MERSNRSFLASGARRTDTATRDDLGWDWASETRCTTFSGRRSLLQRAHRNGLRNSGDLLSENSRTSRDVEATERRWGSSHSAGAGHLFCAGPTRCGPYVLRAPFGVAFSL